MEALKDEAAGAVRSLISGIRMIPQDGKLMIELIGELAGILALGKGERPRPFGQGRQTTVVAGAGFAQDHTQDELAIAC